MIEVQVDTKKLLSRKEEETFKRLAAGLTYQAIADETSRSEETVKTHAKAIREKFHAHNLVQAISIAAANGLIVFKNKGGLFAIALVLASQFNFDDTKIIRTVKNKTTITRKIDAA